MMSNLCTVELKPLGSTEKKAGVQKNTRSLSVNLRKTCSLDDLIEGSLRLLLIGRRLIACSRRSCATATPPASATARIASSLASQLVLQFLLFSHHFHLFIFVTIYLFICFYHFKKFFVMFFFFVRAARHSNSCHA